MLAVRQLEQSDAAAVQRLYERAVGRAAWLPAGVKAESAPMFLLAPSMPATDGSRLARATVIKARSCFLSVDLLLVRTPRSRRRLASFGRLLMSDIGLTHVALPVRMSSGLCPSAAVHVKR